MIILYFILLLSYIIILLWVVLGIYNLPYFKIKEQIPSVSFSIIIPFRNEQNNLPQLLSSLSQLDFPKKNFEIILVNDDSNDNSITIINQFSSNFKDINLSVISNNRRSKSPKKDAITTAIALAKNDWIITTDADCKVPKKWLLLYDQYITKYSPKMICGPVLFTSTKKGLLYQFQFLDNLSLQAVTQGSFYWKHPLLCNAANMGYKREVFLQVRGYSGNTHIASGDDIFLLEKIKGKFPRAIGYLKNNEATVTTQMEVSWKSAIQQRIRWASKTTHISNRLPQLIGLVVFSVNVLFISCLFIFPFYSEHHIYIFYIFLKLFFDGLVLLMISYFFKKPISVIGYFINCFIHPLVLSWVVFQSFRGNYLWKERNFKK